MIYHSNYWRLFLICFPRGSDDKESICSVRDLNSIPGLERSPGGGHGNPLQYSCLENSLGHKELDMTEVTLHVHMHLYMYGCFILLYSRN